LIPLIPPRTQDGLAQRQHPVLPPPGPPLGRCGFLSNALLYGLRVAVPAVTPTAGRGGEVIGRNLDRDDPDAVRVLDPHLDQTPGLRSRLPYNHDSSRGQPGVLGVDIPDLDERRSTPVPPP
jgi:hypothetical protein